MLPKPRGSRGPRQHRACPFQDRISSQDSRWPSTPLPGAQAAGQAQAPSALRGAGGTDLQAARAFRRSEDPDSCISSGNLGGDTCRAAAADMSSDALAHGQEPGLSGLRGTRSQSSACRCQGLWLSSRWVNLPSGNLPVCPVPTCSPHGGGASDNGGRA